MFELEIVVIPPNGESKLSKFDVGGDDRPLVVDDDVCRFIAFGGGANNGVLFTVLLKLLPFVVFIELFV